MARRSKNLVGSNPTSIPTQITTTENKLVEREGGKADCEYCDGTGSKNALVPNDIKRLQQRGRFTQEMVQRAREDGIKPSEILYCVAIDPDFRFTDWAVYRGEAIQIERGATFAERMDAAKTILPYFESKKPVELEHSGAIEILHAIAETPLDAITLDEHGNVVDADFDDDFDE